MILSDTACFYLGAGFALGMLFLGNGIGQLGSAIDDNFWRIDEFFSKWLDRVHPEPEVENGDDD
jgi:hypothetical protein